VSFAAKCYWPQVTPGEVESAATAVVREAQLASGAGPRVGYVGALLFPNDSLVLCLFEGSSPAAVAHVSERAGIPCERVMQSVWLPNPWPERTRP
jgi:hypothetical protein